MHTPYDRSSKWLIEHHGDAILRLGGVGDIHSWRAVQTLAVTQVMSRLRYNSLDLMKLFGGKNSMIESPLIQELLAEQRQEYILRVLAKRFRSLPTELEAAIHSVQEKEKLDELVDWAADCPDLGAFQAKVTS